MLFIKLKLPHDLLIQALGVNDIFLSDEYNQSYIKNICLTSMHPFTS